MSIEFAIVVFMMAVTATALVVRPLQSVRLARDAGHARLPVLFAGAAIAAAVLLYAAIGRPGATLNPEYHSMATAYADDSGYQPGASRGKLDSVAVMTERLAKRLNANGDDAGGWLLLAKSYERLGRHGAAIAAYEQAVSRGKSDKNLERSLLLGNEGDTRVDTIAATALRGRVSISAEAASLLQPEDIVFIFAKESREHRMPVVAIRKPARQLPLEFVLTDAEAMVPGTQLANYENLVVTARISRSGLASDVVEGLQAWSNPVSPGNGENVQLAITTDMSSEVAGNE